MYKFLYILWCFDSIVRHNAIKKHKLQGLVQNHHIIPRQWRFHNAVIASNYSIDSSNNLLLMPTSYGKYFLNTSRYVHSGGHNNYNYYVKTLLDFSVKQNISIEEVRFYLKQVLRTGSTIPWV